MLEDSWVLCHSWIDSKFASSFTTSHAIFHKKKYTPSLHFIPPPPPWRSIEQISVDSKQNNSKDLVSLFYSKQKEAELKSWIKHFKILNRAFARILCGCCPRLFHRCKRHSGKSGTNNTISWNLKTELETIPNVYVIHHDVSSVHFALCFFHYSISTTILEDRRQRRRFPPFRPGQQSAAFTHEYAEWLRIESIDEQPDFCIAVSSLVIFPHVITPSYAIIFFFL